VPERAPLGQFLIYLFILLLPCFALWHVAAMALALPVIGFADTVLGPWFPGVVDTLYADGRNALLVTHFGESGGRPVPLAGADYQLGFTIDTRVLSYSLPFYTALHFANPRQNYFNDWILGLLLLYPLMALGLLSLCLKELMVGLGAVFLEQADAWVPDPNLIGLAYQISVLLVPTLAPAMIWLWQSRETPVLRALLPRRAVV